MLFESGFQGGYLLLPLKFFLTERCTGLKFVILYLNGEVLPTFPASVQPLINGISQRQTAFNVTLRTFDCDSANFTCSFLLFLRHPPAALYHPGLLADAGDLIYLILN